MSYPGHLLGEGLTPLQRCSQCILQSQPPGSEISNTFWALIEKDDHVSDILLCTFTHKTNSKNVTFINFVQTVDAVYIYIYIYIINEYIYIYIPKCFNIDFPSKWIHQFWITCFSILYIYIYIYTNYFMDSYTLRHQSWLTRKSLCL